jgi:4-diphosphocytidyl-2-C-methyl-D-erythritol kinase
MATETETALARAKVNLCLHVTGRRADGYHLLDSLVVFAGTGDRVTVTAAPALSLCVGGPQGAGLSAGEDNLCLRAARSFPAGQGAQIRLEKHLPVASGIGGGSADAAAVLQALSRLWRQPLPGAAAVLALGADVPVCLAGRPARMRGVGESISPLGPLPQGWLVLANPGLAVSTPEVFRALTCRENAPLPEELPAFADTVALAAFLRGQRNDLEAPARALVPVIGQVTAALAAQPGCLLARMSGSGATCYGLFAEEQAALRAAGMLRRAQPGWWVEAAEMVQPGATAGAGDARLSS